MTTLRSVESTVRDVQDTLVRMSIVRDGVPLSRRDNQTMADVISLWLVIAIDVSPPFAARTSREHLHWATTVAQMDMLNLAKQLGECSVFLRNYYSAGSWTPNRFKRRFFGKEKKFSILLSPVWDMLHAYLARPNSDDLAVLMQFLLFISNTTLSDVKDDLESEYISFEKNLRDIRYPEQVVKDLNKIMRSWFSSFSFDGEGFIPSHGPGASYECSRTNNQLRKYRFLRTDMRLDYFVKNTLRTDLAQYSPVSITQGPIRQCKLAIVPKSIKTKRVISVEPTSLMYFQQGAQRQIMSYVHSHQYLGKHIDLRRQSKNQVLALRGSEDGSLSTIDLSSASDSVTYSLAKSVFHGTKVYPALVCLRSTHVELPTQGTLALQKFAPMGSALCFPIETLIFACIVELAARYAAQKWGISSSTWAVYGDDIIVETDLYWEVVLLLRQLHFTVNGDKCFTAPARFRESCGCDAFDGIDITPVKISRKFSYLPRSRQAVSPEQYEALIDFANNLYANRLLLTRAIVIRSLLESSHVPPLFSEGGERGLISPCPDNFRARRREWRDGTSPFVGYQQDAIYVRQVSSRITRKKSAEPEAIRYFETLRRMALRHSACDSLIADEPVLNGAVSSYLVNHFVIDGY